MGILGVKKASPGGGGGKSQGGGQYPPADMRRLRHAETKIRVILSEAKRVEGSADYGEPIANQRRKRMSFRAAKRRGILPITEKSRLYPALEQDERLPQSGRPFDFAQGDRLFVFAGSQSAYRNRQDSTGALRPLNDIYFIARRNRPCGRILSAPTGRGAKKAAG